MTETSETVTWLTQEAYDRLKAEYDYLTGEGRAEIVKRIEAAREEGDLKENGGYHAAKEEQGKREARIRQLRQLLESAQVGEAPAGDAGVRRPRARSSPSTSAATTMRFLLGSPRGGRRRRHRGLLRESPLGAAIDGQQRRRAR